MCEICIPKATENNIKKQKKQQVVDLQLFVSGKRHFMHYIEFFLPKKTPPTPGDAQTKLTIN